MYIDDSGGGGDTGQAVGSIAEGMAKFASMAASGSFEVNDTGGQALLKTIHKMQDWLNSQLVDLYRLTQEMPLGSSHAAEVMKPYLRNVATDAQGFLTQLQQFRESLAKADQGIRTAMANYRATEETNKTALRKAGPA